MAVDIGAEAIDRGSYLTVNDTYINKDTPATSAGTITSIDIWARTDIENLIVGTFYVVSGDTLKCRASQAIEGTITEGDKVVKTVSITVEIGDYIGCYFTGGGPGRIENDTAGFAGVWHVSGEHIDPDDEEDYGFWADDAMSLGGYIGAAGPTTGWNQIVYTSEPPTPNAWNQVKQDAGAGFVKIWYDSD